VNEIVFTGFLAHQLQGSISNDLIGIHVGAGASATLNGINHEVLIKLSVHNLLAGKLDVLGSLGLQATDSSIHSSCCLLHEPNGLD